MGLTLSCILDWSITAQSYRNFPTNAATPIHDASYKGQEQNSPLGKVREQMYCYPGESLCFSIDLLNELRTVQDTGAHILYNIPLPCSSFHTSWHFLWSSPCPPPLPTCWLQVASPPAHAHSHQHWTGGLFGLISGTPLTLAFSHLCQWNAHSVDGIKGFYDWNGTKSKEVGLIKHEISWLN